MTLLILIAVLVTETFWTQISELRRHQYIVSYADKWQALFDKNNSLNPWLVMAIVLAPPLILVAVLIEGQQGVIGSLFELVLSLLVVTWCLGPQSLAVYYQSLTRSNSEDTETEDSEQQGGQQQAEALFDYVHQAYFGVIIWFVLLGPVAALAYRMVATLASRSSVTTNDSINNDDEADASEYEEVPNSNRLWQTVYYVVDWIPSRLTCLMFMLTGNFSKGLSAVRQGLFDAEYDNSQLVQEAGLSSLTLDNESDYLSEARQLTERSLLLLMVLVALVSFFQF
ncbi:regulatory signaling modulator protein AmpE [Pleionea mediterranea]|uniref:Membrane protein required for beta-lactamase induction n=1 Tax=Pleionea mediterranea TaxID=523701 RepID=A0A316GI02_9GAMM|nr:regulatory signaling modulator protein AmpE [Pleionea mediterranea]PWK54407.1 membrane protein required for beta-lactamase induction [Pleionea mediterranea]